MNTMLITGFGLVVLAVIAWQSLRERERDSRQIPPEWVVSIGRIANEQALGHHRDARRGVLQLFNSIKRHPGRSRLAHHMHLRLAALLAKDPVYPEVVKEIRSACAADAAVSELTLCVRLRQFLIEDIRQCEEIAEHFGQIRRREQGAEALLIARFQQTA